MTRVRIGCQVDHEARHYRFERNSGLPVGYYHRERPLFAFGWRAVVVIAVVTAVYLLAKEVLQ